MATSIDLPPEILGEIFLELCSRPQDNDITGLNGSQSIIISSVCKYWREVSLSMPELWSKFRLYVPNCYMVVEPGPMIPLQLHLERSRNFPLTFILLHKGSLQYPVPHYIRYLNLLWDNAHRWGDACIPLGLPFNGMKEFSALHTLRIVDLSRNNCSSFVRAPNIRHLEFIRGRISLSAMEIDWSRILSLSISRGATDVLAILCHCTQLQQLRMHSTYICDFRHGQQISGMRDSYLLSLYFTVAPGDTDLFECLLNRFALPVAVRIEVVLEECPAVQMPHTTFLDFVVRCKSLKELAVRGFNVTYEQLLEYPLVVPSITRLEGTVEQDIATANFETALTQAFARCAQLTEVQILGFDDNIRVEYHAARAESNEISLTVTYIMPGCIF